MKAFDILLLGPKYSASWTKSKKSIDLIWPLNFFHQIPGLFKDF